MATSFSVIGVLALTGLVTDTVTLNQEIERYTVARNALDDLRNEWRLQNAPLPSIATADLCAATSAPWLAFWCAENAGRNAVLLPDLQFCAERVGADWRLRAAWGGADCAAVAVPSVSAPLR